MRNTISCVFVLLVAAADCKRLDDYIRHFEELNYDRETVSTGHSRMRRSTTDKQLFINFPAFGRHFSLQLLPDTTVFSPNAQVEIDGRQEPLDTSHIVTGTLWGLSGSSVHGSVIDGRFAGKINDPDSGSYRVEYAEKFFKSPNFHSVIYKDDDVEVEKFHNDLRARRAAESGSGGGCGNSDPDVSSWMRAVQKSALPEPADELKQEQETEEDQIYKYTLHGQQPQSHRRVERQTSTGNKKTCTLFLQSDPELWRYFNGTEFGGKGTADQVKERISSLFADHVNEVNGIYTTTTFRDTVGGKTILYGGYNFRVDRVLINTTQPCDNSVPSDDHPYCLKAIDASNLLNLNSYRNHDDYCLAFIFTYRDFTGGTLGLAWVADPGPSKGGICTKWSRYSDDSPGSFVSKSLNTGIVTLVNYGKSVPRKVSIITFAHEVGHNFGAPHDNPDTDPSCAPLSSSKSTAGNYIMFASATSGDMPNNNKFSQCSIAKVGAVLTAVSGQLNGHTNCLQASGQAFCGNAIKETNETCDCGYQSDCMPGDVSCCSCCVGATDSLNSNACKLKPGKDCDPSSGPCCNSSCTFYSAAEKIICKPITECQEQSVCDGNSPRCPTAIPKANLTACNGNTQVCINGECAASICTKIDPTHPWSDCEPPLLENENADALCYISCQERANSTCWSSNRVSEKDFPPLFRNLLASISGNRSIKAITLSPGRACNSFKGYCDVFHKCRLVDADGPLARLKNLLFNPSTLAAVKNWIEVNWWAVALIVLGLILLMAGFIKLCAVHTPSSNPRKPKARRLSETLTLRRRRAAAAESSAAAEGRPRPQHPTAGTSEASSGAPPPPYSGLNKTRPVNADGKGKAKREKYEMR